MTVAIELRIRGRVHGVGFRAGVGDEALRRGLRGWVRNRRDGSVEALLVGARDDVEGMIGACRHGPPLARVDAIERREAADDGSPGFRQLPTV
jgi:acylphosphatase